MWRSAHSTHHYHWNSPLNTLINNCLLRQIECDACWMFEHVPIIYRIFSDNFFLSKNSPFLQSKGNFNPIRQSSSLISLPSSFFRWLSRFICSSQLSFPQFQAALLNVASQMHNKLIIHRCQQMLMLMMAMNQILLRTMRSEREERFSPFWNHTQVQKGERERESECTYISVHSL